MQYVMTQRPLKMKELNVWFLIKNDSEYNEISTVILRPMIA